MSGASPTSLCHPGAVEADEAVAGIVRIGT